jgi:hypothetical protein
MVVIIMTMKNGVFADVTLVALVRTDVLEELSASIIKVTRIGELGTTLAVTINLMMEVLSYSEKSALKRATRHNVLEDAILHNHRCENPKSYTIMTIIIAVLVLIITDMGDRRIKMIFQPCFQVNTVPITAVISVDAEGSIRYLCIENDARLFITACWPFTWWCRSQPLPDEERLLANRTRRHQSFMRTAPLSEDDELLEDHQVYPVSIKPIIVLSLFKSVRLILLKCGINSLKHSNLMKYLTHAPT